MKDLKKKRVIVSIDPGYDGTKVTVNGSRFSIPKKTIKKIGNEYETTGTLAGIYEVKTAEGVFICGENIKALINNNEDLHERFDKGSDQNGNYSYFNTAEFRANTLAAIGIALEKAVRAGIIDDAEKADLYVVVTLPHTALDSMHNAVKMITGKQNFTISGDFTRLPGDTEDSADTSTEKSFNIEIKQDGEHFIVISQVIACLLGYITDEDGYEMDNLKDAYNVIVIDGGYYTVGDFEIDKTKAISKAKSKTAYGMMKIHEITAAKINEICQRKYKDYNPDLKYYDMDSLFDEDNGEIIIPRVYTESGKNEVFNATETLQAVVKDVFNEYLAYLEDEYNYFARTKTILFGGGTGKIYYDLYMKLAEQNYPNVKAVLVTYTLDGNSVTPREAISAGAYKMMLNRLDD